MTHNKNIPLETEKHVLKVSTRPVGLFLHLIVYKLVSSTHFCLGYNKSVLIIQEPLSTESYHKHMTTIQETNFSTPGPQGQSVQRPICCQNIQEHISSPAWAFSFVSSHLQVDQVAHIH